MLSARLITMSLVFCLVLGSCKKTIDQLKEQYVLGVMTTGQWFLENYTENGVDNTADFKDYKFQFYEDNKISATTSTDTQTGTWQGNTATLTMTIQFASTDPKLQRISYPWLFTDAHIGLVFAETTTASGKITIRLRKIQ